MSERRDRINLHVTRHGPYESADDMTIAALNAIVAEVDDIERAANERLEAIEKRRHPPLDPGHKDYWP